jgi:hypothetical protein
VARGERKSSRVSFDPAIDAFLMGIDGTWRRNCQLADISTSGARVIVSGTIEGLNLKEFFLLLTSTGLAFRRCELVRVNGDEIGVRFLKKREILSKPIQGQGSRPAHAGTIANERGSPKPTRSHIVGAPVKS